MRLLPVVAVLALLSPVAAKADAIVDKLMAQSARAPMLPFERTVRQDELGASKPASIVKVDRFNPKAPAGAQWTLLSVDGRPPTADEVERHRKDADAIPVPGFHRLNKILVGTPTVRTDAQGRSIYRWDSLPAGAVVSPGPDFSRKLSAEMVVETIADKPTISAVRIFAAKPFSIMGVARMNAFDAVSLYQPGAGGLPFLTAQTTATDVSAPFGKGGKRRSQVSFKPL